MADETTPTNSEEEVKEEVAEEPIVSEAGEEPEPEAPEPEEAEPEPEPEPEKPVSRRESLRIQQLVSKLKQAQQPPTPTPPTGGLDYGTALEADPETVKQLEDDRQKYGQTLYQQGVDQARTIQFHTRLEIDAPRIEAKFPQLNKEAAEFNPALADAVNNWYLATAGYDPQTNSVRNADVRYSDFVEGIMEMADEIATTKTASAAKNIAKQAATTGLRPDGSAAKMNLNKAPEDMTDAELDAVLGQAFPRDNRGRFAPR